jgi:hypothetical protein
MLLKDSVVVMVMNMQSEGVLVGNRQSLLQRPDLLPVVHELLERLEAHLVAEGYYSVTCNMRGQHPEEVAGRMRDAGLGGLQGPTVSKVAVLPRILNVSNFVHVVPLSFAEQKLSSAVMLFMVWSTKLSG